MTDPQVAPAAPLGDVSVPRVVLAGAHGHGRGHLENLARLHAAGRVRFVGVADPRALCLEEQALAGDGAWAPDLRTLLGTVTPDVVVICTPVHTHTELAETALRAGAHVLLEKPVAPTLADFEHLVAVQRETGLAVQVGFQANGSGAVTELRRRIAAGDLGEIRGIGATGLWWRGEAYWNRAAWAGRRRLDGREVNDGALTNPFAHAIAIALVLDGSGGGDPVRRVELDTYRTRAPESHDTASVRILTARGTPVTVAATLCAEPESEPVVTVHGSLDSVELHYTEDLLISAEGATRHTRTDLLENLLDHLADRSVELLVPLAGCLAFTQVVEAVRHSPDPLPVAQEDLVDLIDLTRRAAAGGSLYSELGADWARATPFTWTPASSTLSSSAPSSSALEGN
ncbi:Gfo/Idh/MocA family protein [Actinoplanes derwentensis]|uniref:Predicted dehydrogenase n=1 Tax=Actinoplanes derwentensis TaxID=113562 RepID=A0A1H1RN92_9ACTN|nr:Gfo/Idh/MocA family oxidoreductase [Actinoplanes derwentensis]GID84472.1 oxidoreductase [Actinoplanes derwentensis]SDS37103.1 Predicted dehydrogenase [Actinoplanes derwentensis]